jgi:flagellin FlaB
MKKAWKKFDKRAEMGVGTMIIFIAMVLVAAVAASVLISTANTVREQAQNTGEQAIQNVASGFITYDVVGTVSATFDTLDQVDIYMRLAAGSPSINIGNVVVSATDGAETLIYDYTGAAGADEQYTAAQVLVVSSVGDWTTAAVDMVGQGDLIKVTLDLTAFTTAIGNSQNVEIKIMPAYGQNTLVQFYTPEVFDTDMINFA